jgi:hypothetical protein
MDLRPHWSLRAHREAAEPALGRLQKRWPRDILLWMPGNESVLYQAYPYILRPAFPTVDDERVQRLALACRVFFESIIIADKIVDDHRDTDLGLVYLQTVAMQFESYRLYQELIDRDAVFWERLRSVLVAYTAACSRERRVRTHVESLRDLTSEIALEIALGKYPFGRVAAFGLVELSRDDRNLDAVAASIEQFDLASYYWDDVMDWRKDLRDGTPSLALARALDAFPELRNGDLAARSEEFARAFYYGRLAEQMLQQGIDHLSRAAALVAHLPMTDWRVWLTSFAEAFERKRQSIADVVVRNLRRRSSPTSFTELVHS